MTREYEPETSVAGAYDDRYQEYRAFRETWVGDHRSFRFWPGGINDDA
jgi:hypothetical protein